jgi:hypothetical protein
VDTARWLLFVVSGVGSVGAVVFVARLWWDWTAARNLHLLDRDFAVAWRAKFRQSMGLSVILICITAFALSSIYSPDGRGWRWLLLMIASAVGDWKVYRLFTDRFDAEVRVGEAARTLNEKLTRLGRRDERRRDEL